MKPLRWACLVLACGIGLRAWAALSGIPILYPDEHFQTLEPASKVVYGVGWMSWEWQVGVRSWIVPALFMPVLGVLKLAGIPAGPASILACRLWIALWSLAALWGFHRLLLDRGIRPVAHMVTLGLLCMCPAMVLWSATTFSDTWVLVCLWALVPRMIRLIQGEEPRRWILAGVCLGLTFPLRIQMVIWAAGLGLVLLLRKSDRRILPELIAGYMIPVVAQGLLDWLTWGRLFHSTVANIDWNVFRGFASLNGVHPWHDYFRLAWTDLGPLFIMPVLALIGLALALRRVAFQRMDALVLIPAALFVLVHIAIPHKENRFILPAYPALFYLFALALDGLCGRMTIPIPAIVAGCVALAPMTAFALKNPDRYARYDLGDLTREIHRDGGFRREPAAALLLVDRYWVWTRGEMGLGMHVDFYEVTSRDIRESTARNCLYAIVPGSFEEAFKERTEASWMRLKSDAHGNVLLKRDLK